ncbi:hypothetical protein PMIN04_011428 [Paraphaeosphaeria minitans]
MDVCQSAFPSGRICTVSAPTHLRFPPGSQKSTASIPSFKQLQRTSARPVISHLHAPQRSEHAIHRPDPLHRSNYLEIPNRAAPTDPALPRHPEHHGSTKGRYLD